AALAAAGPPPAPDRSRARRLRARRPSPGLPLGRRLVPPHDVRGEKWGIAPLPAQSPVSPTGVHHPLPAAALHGAPRRRRDPLAGRAPGHAARPRAAASALAARGAARLLHGQPGRWSVAGRELRPLLLSVLSGAGAARRPRPRTRRASGGAVARRRPPPPAGGSAPPRPDRLAHR